MPVELSNSTPLASAKLSEKILESFPSKYILPRPDLPIKAVPSSLKA
jgi:hypothetical protein